MIGQARLWGDDELWDHLRQPVRIWVPRSSAEAEGDYVRLISVACEVDDEPFIKL